MISAVQSLSALAQDARLAAYRLLVRAGPDGLAAGELARRLDTAPNTLSAQLHTLAQAGLVRSRREGRSIIYAADYGAVQSLLAYLIEDCCQGRAEICMPLAGLLERVACCAA
jgi:ArsR family transcriptional regulator